jgi:hypothetical protein
MNCRTHLSALAVMLVTIGSPVLAQQSRPLPTPDPAVNIFVGRHAGTRSDFTGNVGYEFVSRVPLRIIALGRSVSGSVLQRSHRIVLWDTTSHKPLAEVTISPSSHVDQHGFAMEPLSSPISLTADRKYRITSSEVRGGDPMVDIGDLRDHLAVVEILRGAYAEGDRYPEATYGGAEQGYGVPAFFLATTGLEAALLKPPSYEPQPMLRDISTGYLLHYNFLSPRPYCWKGDPLLSGWEVDKSGGSWQCHPTGVHPGGFAFHSDWFKLVDSSPSAAVTLRHQIARQTQGSITLEYRFRMPTKMDGAAWQLCDLHQPGVSLVTADGSLCCETPNGAHRVLLRYEADHDYGVKIVAALEAKTADVYVDGSLVAAAVPFCRPIDTVDYVLVKTGEAATGEMFIAPVNVHKGYAVQETFVASGVAKFPEDWKLERGEASVQPFECCSKPDIFSLKLSGAADTPAAVSKRFAPCHARTVLEYRFLLPEKCDGAVAELGGLRVFTAGGNLCYANQRGEPVTLVSQYRANLWYMIKVLADPKSETADMFINGKPAAQQATFSRGSVGFDTLRFQSPAVLWLDDVAVYPWQDYPADYVPEPKPCPAKDGYLPGLQSCNLWREGNAYAGWEYVYPYRADRKPYLGWYDEGNPEETDWEIKWQVEHGIGFEMHCWYRPNNARGRPIKDGVLDQQIIKGLFNARYGNLAKFAIMMTDEGACETGLDDLRENIIPYWVEYFFKDPRYLKIDGKPVLSVYHLGHLKRMMGGEDGARKAIQLIRDEVAKAGFPGILVLMECREANVEVFKAMQRIGVDACYAYTWSTRDASAQRARMTAQRTVAASIGFQVLPSISIGWDREPWGVHDGGWVSTADYKALAEWTRDAFMPSLPTDALGRRVVMLANWNEFGEGHFMLPNASGGFGYLDALREVFTAGGPHEDLRPTEQQKCRITILYPKE